MHHQNKSFKSWPGLKKQLEGRLCGGLRGRVTYYLTYYREVHDSYGRAAVRLDGEELARFSWRNGYVQEQDVSDAWKRTGEWDWDDAELKSRWNAEGIFCERDFLSAALRYLDLPITEALQSDDLLVRLFAILDRRAGIRTLQKISASGEYLRYPEWLRQFYLLRLSGFETPACK